MNLKKNIAAVLFAACCAVLLGGCAAQMAYRDGKNLVEQGKMEEGLARFQKAAQKDPANAQYKAAFLQTRDRTVVRLLQQADQLTDARKRDEAKALYQRVLAVDPTNERALTGLQNLVAGERHDRMVQEAQELQAHDPAAAKSRLDSVLAEDPKHEQARALMKELGLKSAQPSAESLLSAAYRKPISIEFKDVAIKRIFEVISRGSGLNFIFDKDVRLDQKTSVFLRNSTIESALYYTLLTNQLEQQVLDANTVLIYPGTMAKQKDYQDMMVRSFFLTNVEAKTMASTLKTILKTRDIVVDDKLNMMIVRDSPEAIKLAEKLVALEDVPEPEVMLEVEILEISRTRLQELGIKWPDTLTLSPLASTNAASGTTGVLTVDDLRGLHRGNIGVTISPVTINAKQQDSDVNILANPRIRARNHEKAKILIGERVPNITTTSTATGFASESINYVDVGLKLDVEPTVYLDNEVAIKIALEVSSIVSQLQTKSGSVAYQIGTRNASTVLRLKDGENQVLAGLINNEEHKNADKVPGIGELPLIGRLFGSTNNNDQKTEIVLSITPHLVRNIQRPESSLALFRFGTENSMRERPDSGGHAVSMTPAVSSAPQPAAATGEPSASAPSASPQSSVSGEGGGMSENLADSSDENKAPKPASYNASAPPGGEIGNGVSSVGGQLQVTGPGQSRVGSNFTVQIKMQSDLPITQMPVTVGFDSNVLQVVRVDEGDFFRQGGAPSEFSSQIDPSGQIIITGGRTDGTGASAAASVATVVFHTIAPADKTQIQLQAATPSGPGGNTVPAVLPAPFVLHAAQ